MLHALPKMAATVVKFKVHMQVADHDIHSCATQRAAREPVGGMKRNRAPAVATRILVHDTILNHLRHLQTEEARRVLNAGGMPMPGWHLGIASKKKSLTAQAEAFKAEFPDCVILLRVGEFFEAFGVDAVLILDTCQQTYKGNGVCIASRTIQARLDRLVARGLRCALFEETSVCVQPRHRVFSQIVTDATPIYLRAPSSAADGEDAPEEKPVVAVGIVSDGRWDVSLCFVSTRRYFSHVQIDAAMVTPILSQAATPIVCVGERAALLLAKKDSHVCLGRAAETSVEERLLDYVQATYHVPRAHMRRTRPPTDSGSCMPLPWFTRQQLGLCGNDAATPSLVAACLTPRASLVIRRQMLAWLTAPPPHADTLRRVVAGLVSSTAPLPTLAVGRHERCIAARLRADVAGLTALHVNVEAIIAALATCDQQCSLSPCCPAGELAWRIACREMAHPTATHFAEVDALLGPALATLGVAVGGRWKDAVGAHMRDLLDVCRLAMAQRDAYLDAYLPQQWVRERQWTHMYGASAEDDPTTEGDPETIACFDKNLQRHTDRHTTRALYELDTCCIAAQAMLEEARERELRKLCAALVEHEAALFVADTWARELSTIAEHVRAVGRLWTHATVSTDASLRCRGMLPYWMYSNGVPNSVELLSGTSVVLTGANGGGKSTLLRSVASVALLAQCGLMVPCAVASVPPFAHIFLRISGQDCVVQRQGSFAAEMHDMSTMLRAASVEPALILLDEPCRGTTTSQGVALLDAILCNMPALATVVITTHFVELQAPTCEWMQLTFTSREQDERDCGRYVPSYRLSHGKSNDSMALSIALAAGLPEAIVGAARLTDDVDTLLKLTLRRLHLEWRRIAREQTLPASTRSIVYVIPTRDGIYIGESDRGDQRIALHRATKDFEAFYIIPVKDKTAARAVETTLEREFLSHNVRLVSVCDAHHAIA